jgi:ABC-2 type transport system permease protein
MKSIIVSLSAEMLKIRKSRVFGLILLFFAFIPCMMGLLMFVQKYPAIADKLGMIGTKATMLRFGEPNWLNFFNLLCQSNAAIGLIGYGFVTTWIFGREYTDHTIKDMLALPVSRMNIVISKFIAVLIWCILLMCVLFAAGILIGQVIHLSGWSLEIVIQSIHKYMISSLLTILLCTPVAFFASYSRGFLLPLGFIILTLIIANFTGLVGLGPYFPWAIAGIYCTPTGEAGMQLGMVSYIILFVTSIIGFFGTGAWWVYADQK